MYVADHGVTSGGGSSGGGGAGRSDTATVSPAHVGYQSSRRSASRGLGTYRGRGGRFQPPVWSAPTTFQYLQFGTAAH